MCRTGREGPRYGDEKSVKRFTDYSPGAAPLLGLRRYFQDGVGPTVGSWTAR